MQKILVYIAVACLLVAQTPVRNPIFSGSIASGTGPVHLTTGTPSVGAINLATEITGTLPAASVPTPTASTLGGVRSITCSGTDKISSIATTGIPACTTDSGVGGGASIQTDLTDIKVTTNGTNTISVPAGAMPRFAQTVCANYGGGSIVMTTGNATVYMSVTNNCTIQATSTATFGTATALSTAVGSAFPANHFPLAHCAYDGTGPTITCIDDRRAFSAMPLLAGLNVSITPSASGYTIASSGASGGDMSLPMGGCLTTGLGTFPTWGVAAGITTGCNGQDFTMITYQFNYTATPGGYITYYSRLPRTFPGTGATVSVVADVSQIDVATPTGTVGKFNLYFSCKTPGTSALSPSFFTGSSQAVEFSTPNQFTTAAVTFSGVTVGAECVAGALMGIALQRDNTTTGTNFTHDLQILAVQFRYD